MMDDHDLLQIYSHGIASVRQALEAREAEIAELRRSLVETTETATDERDERQLAERRIDAELARHKPCHAGAEAPWCPACANNPTAPCPAVRTLRGEG